MPVSSFIFFHYYAPTMFDDKMQDLKNFIYIALSKYHFVFLISFGILLVTQPLYAAPKGQDRIVLNNIDVTAVVAAFRSKIVTLNKSIMVYNWTHYKESGYWDKDIKEDDPGAVSRVSTTSKSFWQSFGSAEAGNMYGRGLYAASDPVNTFSFGGGADKWMITQMELPVGFRFLDLANPNVIDIKQHKDVLSAFLCPLNENHINFIETLFSEGGRTITPQCRSLVKTIYQGHIDGFFYSYDAAPFKACDSSVYLNQVAVVITDSNWVNSNRVKVMNVKTTGHLEDRRRIQTLFLESSQFENFERLENLASAKIYLQLQSYPDRRIHSQQTSCKESACDLEIQFCNNKNECNSVVVDSLLRPGGRTITAWQAKGTEPGEPEGLLWSDLDGQLKSDTINEWLLQNVYGCDGNLPYKAEP